MCSSFPTTLTFWTHQQFKSTLNQKFLRIISFSHKTYVLSLPKTQKYLMFWHVFTFPRKCQSYSRMQCTKGKKFRVCDRGSERTRSSRSRYNWIKVCQLGLSTTRDRKPAPSGLKKERARKGEGEKGVILSNLLASVAVKSRNVASS